MAYATMIICESVLTEIFNGHARYTPTYPVWPFDSAYQPCSKAEPLGRAPCLKWSSRRSYGECS